MDAPHLHPESVGVLLGFIDHRATNKAWRPKSRSSWQARRAAFDVVARFHGGAALAGEDVAFYAGLDAGYCRRLLDELADARMIFREGAAGSRSGWVWVNPDWRGWQHVVWRLDKRDVDARLRTFEVLRDAGATNRLVAYIQGSTRLGAVVACNLLGKARDEASAGEPNPQDEGPGPAPKPGTVAGKVRKSTRRRRHLALVDKGEHATNQRGAKKGFFPSCDDASAAPFDESEQQQNEVDDGSLRRAKAAVYRRAVFPKGRWIRGAPERALKALLVEYGEGSVIDATLLVETGVHQAPGFIEELGVVLAAGGAIDPDPAGDELVEADREAAAQRQAADRLAAVDAKIADLHELIATAEQRGADKRAGSLRAELAECENERDRLVGSSTA